MTRSLKLPGRAGSLVLATAVLAIVLALGSGVSAVRADAATSSAFLPHQALYDLNLLRSRGSASVSSARVRLVYSISGSACEGYTTATRQTMVMESGEDKVVHSDSLSKSWEDSAGNNYHFEVYSKTDDGESPPIEGVAERTGDHLTVKLKQPKVETVTLDGNAVFPTQQIQRIIEAARAGKSVLELAVFDGSENGETVYKTLSVIGHPIPGDQAPTDPDLTTSNDTMKSLTRWPVTVSYYDRDTKSSESEQTPVYSISFELYENGVSRAVELDYNDFVVSGAMGKFDIKDSKPCK